MTVSAFARLRRDQTVRQFVRFVLIGVVNTGFGLAVYTLLVLAGLPAQMALILAYVAGVIWNYFTHARFVFGQRGLTRLPYYVVAYLAVYGFNAICLGFLIGAGLGKIGAQVVLAPVAAILSFLLIGKALTGRVPLPGGRRG